MHRKLLFNRQKLKNINCTFDDKIILENEPLDRRVAKKLDACIELAFVGLIVESESSIGSANRRTGEPKISCLKNVKLTNIKNF